MRSGYHLWRSLGLLLGSRLLDYLLLIVCYFNDCLLAFLLAFQFGSGRRWDSVRRRCLAYSCLI